MPDNSDYQQYQAEAERLAGEAHHFTYGDGVDRATGHALAAEAQVHATLALAAAVARLAGLDRDQEDQ